MVKTITLAHLYPKQMNVYGDMGNVITLRYRLEKRGFVVNYAPLDSLQYLSKVAPDILLGGGGQDSNQGLVQGDLLRYSAGLKSYCNDGLVSLVICGMYQMFGHRFILPNGEQIEGIGMLDMETIAGSDRLIGNIVINTAFGSLVGFENHSGRTYLGNGLEPLGKVLKGAGNNGEDETEGALYKNVFGTYMHGPALAKNPAFADELIRRALLTKGYSAELELLDDFIEHQAAAVAVKRPR
ncbi:MAG: glutamine amidotransferase [Candidatus Saccharimonadales bacterium]